MNKVIPAPEVQSRQGLSKSCTWARIAGMNKWLFTLSLLCLTAVAHCTDLMDIYLQAVKFDPSFQQAYHAYLSSKEAIPIARAALYPQITGTALINRTVQDVTLNSIQADGTYNSNEWQLNASQAVFNYQAWARVKQAKASVKSAQATFNDAVQDLIIRTSKAYLDVLLARDTLDFAEAKKRANNRQLEQATARFNVGLDAITSVYEAQAGYDQSVAEVITAKNNQINQDENLRKLTNHVYEKLAPLRNNKIPLILPEPNNVDEWIDAGTRQNYKLYSAKYTLEAARDNIKVQASASAPTLAIQANTNDLYNDVNIANFFAPNKQTISSVGFAINFPMFQGGLVVAKTRQARFDYLASSDLYEKAYREVVVNTRIGFNNIVDGISKVKADRQTIVSRVNSLDSTDAQFQVGTRTMVDVVNAQQKLFEAQRQLASDQYNLILAILNLKYLAGTLGANDIAEINTWLTTTRIQGFPPNHPPTIAKGFK